MVTTQNSPSKVDPKGRKNLQGSNLFASPNQARNLNVTIPSIRNNNGRICHSMIFPEPNNNLN
jgi:uncharacterized protein (DUF2141 family)